LIEALKGTGWLAGAQTEKIVLAVDLFDSTRRRLQDAYEEGDPEKKLASYANRILRHNAIIFELYEELDERLGAQLVDFVSDCAVFTLDLAAKQDAMTFALHIVETLGAEGLHTSVGIDYGTVATFSLLDSSGAATRFQQVVGKAVDRAVRLSWIARPGEVLVASQLAGPDTFGEIFQFFPKSAVEVSLDKWYRVGPEDLSVHAVYPLHRAMPPDVPGNMRKFSHYLLELLQEMEAMRQSVPGYWAANEIDLDQPEISKKWPAVDRLLALLEELEAPLKERPPELDSFPELKHQIEAFSGWCNRTRKKVEEVQRLLRGGNATWKGIAGESCRDFIEASIMSIISAALVAFGHSRGAPDGH